MQGMTNNVLFEFNTLESSFRKINYEAAEKMKKQKKTDIHLKMKKKNTVAFWNEKNVTANDSHTHIFVCRNFSDLKATNQHHFFCLSASKQPRFFFSSLTQFIRPYKKCKCLFK